MSVWIKDRQGHSAARWVPPDFDVWELRDVGSDWGPYSSWSRDMLHAIEAGVHWPQNGRTFRAHDPARCR